MTDKSEIPADLMEKAERTLDMILCECTESCGGTEGLRQDAIGKIARALAEERELWQIPPSHMGIPVRLDPNVPPGEVRLDANGAVIGTFTASRP